MPWTFNYVIQDADNHTSRLSMNFNDDLTVLQAQELNTVLQPALKAVMDGGIVSAGAILSLPVITPNDVVEAGSDVEYGARFIFTVAGGYKTSFRIPTFDRTLVPDGGGAVDVLDVNVAGLIDGYVTGFGVTGGTAVGQDYRGEDVTGLSSALEAHAKQRR